MHVTTLARRLSATALAAGLAMGVVACSEDSATDDTSTAQDADESAEGSSEGGAEPDSEEAAEEDAVDEPAEAETPEELSAEEFFPAIMSAMQEAESFRFNVTTTTAGVAQDVTGEGRYTDDGAAVKASSTGAQEVEMILLDQVLYLKSEQMGLGDKWMKVDLEGAAGTLYGILAKSTDPRSVMKAMESPKKLELIGTEEVDGVPANHYRVTIDSSKYATAMGLPAEMGTFLPDEIVQDIWVDAEDRTVKHASTLEIPTPGGGKPTTSTTEGTYSDFGLDVDIEAPPASEVTDAPALPGAA